jgi:hypothetical protein
VLAGGFSATIGIEDNDAIDGNNGSVYGNGITAEKTALNLALKAPYQTPYDKLPLIAGKLVWDQAWGQIQVSGAVAQNRSVLYKIDEKTGVPSATTGITYDKTMNGYAFGGQLTLNADMVAMGDKFYLLGGYSNGINKLGFKNASKDSGLPRNSDGIPQSYTNFVCESDAPNDCQNTKSTFVDMAFLHYWTPTIRQNVIVGMAWVDPGSIARASSAATQKATFSSIGTNLIWSPTKGLDIGVEVLYNRASVGNDTAYNVTNSLNSVGALGCKYSGSTSSATVASSVAAGCSSSGDMIMSRVRIERTF